MRNHKWHFVLISVMFFLDLLLAASAFGQDYSSEPADDPPAHFVGRASEPSRPATAKPRPPSSKRSAITYSTEDIAENPSGTDPVATTASTRDYKVHRTKMVPRRPETSEVPETPEVVDPGGGYPAVDGELHIRPYGPYLAGRRSCSQGERDWFWPGLLGIDLSYSWSADSGSGEFGYYGYRYAWGDNLAYSDDSGYYQAHSMMESDPNAINGNFTTYSTEDIRPSDYGPSRPSEANESPADASVPEATVKPKTQNPKQPKADKGIRGCYARKSSVVGLWKQPLSRIW